MSKFIRLEDLTASSSTDDYGVGQLWTDETAGKQYCWVYNAGADSIAAGDCVGIFSTTPARGHVSSTTATMLYGSDGTTNTAPCAGIGLGTIATGKYGWLQVKGFCSALTTDGGVAAGDLLILDGGSSPVDSADTAVAADQGFNCFGVALAADSSTTLGSAYIRCAFAV